MNLSRCAGGGRIERAGVVLKVVVVAERGGALVLVSLSAIVGVDGYGR